MGAQAVRDDLAAWQEIGVVGVEHRPVVDGPRQVGRGSRSASAKLERDAGQPALGVEADVVGDARNRAACRSGPCRRRGRGAAWPGRPVLARDQRGARRRTASAWVSLPPKPPPMRRDLDGSPHACGHAQHAGDQVLDLAGVLGRGPDAAGRRPRAARPARPGLRDRSGPGRRCQLARQPVRRGGERGRGRRRSSHGLAGSIDRARRRGAAAMVEQRSAIFVLDHRPLGARARLRAAFRRPRRTGPGRRRPTSPLGEAAGRRRSTGLTSFLPGTSGGASARATTPGGAHGRPGPASSRAWARALMAQSRESAARPAGSGMSSI